MKSYKIKLNELDSQMRLSEEEIEKINGGIADSVMAACTCCCDATSVSEFSRAHRPGKKLERQIKREKIKTEE